MIRAMNLCDTARLDLLFFFFLSGLIRERREEICEFVKRSSQSQVKFNEILLNCFYGPF